MQNILQQGPPGAPGPESGFGVAAGPTATGERRTAQYVDRQTRDTSMPLSAKRAMAPTFTAHVGETDYVYTLDEEDGAHIMRCITAEPALQVPPELEGHPVVAVAHSAFVGLAHTASLELPDSVKDIGWNAFANCPALRRVVLPDGISRLDKTWLAGSTQVEELVLPGAVEAVDAAFLKACRPLRLVIGRGTRSVDAPAYWTSVVREIAVDAANPNLSTDGACLYSRDGKTLLRSIVEEERYRVQEGCTEIAPHAFAHNARLRSVEFPSTLETIGEGAFEACGLESLVAPAGLRTICDEAFCQCTALASVCLDDRLEEVGQRAFAGCRALAELALPISVRHLGKEAAAGTPARITAAPESPYLQIEENGLVYQRAGADEPWVLADVLDPFLEECAVRPGTRAIGPAAFANHLAIRQVLLPEGLEEIGAGAFECCPGLRTIDLPQGLRALGTRAFFCTPLEELHLPASLAYLGSCALAYDPVQSETAARAARAGGTSYNYVGMRLKEGEQVGEVSLPQDRAAGPVPTQAQAHAQAQVQAQIQARLAAIPAALPAVQRSAEQRPQGRLSPLRVVVDAGNERFYVESGLLCERLDGYVRVVLYTGPDTSVVVPAEATEIASYAFAGARGIELLVFHNRIAHIGTGGMNMAEPPACLRMELPEPVGGHAFVDVALLPDNSGVRALRNTFGQGRVNAYQLVDQADHAILGTRDKFGRLRYELTRLHDPVLLADAMRQSYEHAVGRNPVDTCVQIAAHEWVAGFDIMADLGFLTRDTIDQTVDEMARRGLVSSTVQLIALKRRRFETANDYSL